MRYVILTLIVVVAVWVIWKIATYRGSSAPHQLLSRRERRAHARELAQLELDKKRQAHRERVRRYIEEDGP